MLLCGLRILLKVSTNLSMSFVGKWDTLAQNVFKRPFPKINLARGFIFRIFCLDVSYAQKDFVKVRANF